VVLLEEQIAEEVVPQLKYELAPNCSVPELIVVPPENVLAPDKVTVPLPAWVKVPEPEITPERVMLEDPEKDIAPLLTMVAARDPTFAVS